LAKNSNARFTKFPRIGGGSGLGFLAKIPKVLRKLFFKSRGVKEVNSLIRVSGGIEWSR
jgi:hypothetical protein